MPDTISKTYSDNITILCSGVALGVFVPALVVHNRLRKMGWKTELVVLENIIYKEKCEKIPQTKVAFHRDFRIALTGQKMTKGIESSIDPKLAKSLLSEWRDRGKDQFIVFSGFWIPILLEYQKKYHNEIKVDLCFMDAGISTSWKPYKQYINHSKFRKIHFYDNMLKRIPTYIRIDDKAVIPFSQRKKRFLMHGGGWGMGTYKSYIQQLMDKGLNLDIIAYEERDCKKINEPHRCFLLNPDWQPWSDCYGEDTCIFPPLASVNQGHIAEYSCRTDYSPAYSLVKKNYAIISKPGGATLMDSFNAATPLIYLESFGEYENCNAELWEALGFAISIQEWLSQDCSLDTLENLHKNILEARSETIDYLDQYYAT